MIEKTTQSVANLGYHAHIYYDPTRTRAVAEQVCAAVGEKFRVEIDGFRDMPVGPHPIANAVPYLMLNRAGLPSGWWAMRPHFRDLPATIDG